MDEIRGAIRAVNLAFGAVKLADLFKKIAITAATATCGIMLIKYLRK